MPNPKPQDAVIAYIEESLGYVRRTTAAFQADTQKSAKTESSEKNRNPLPGKTKSDARQSDATSCEKRRARDSNPGQLISNQVGIAKNAEENDDFSESTAPGAARIARNANSGTGSDVADDNLRQLADRLRSRLSEVDLSRLAMMLTAEDR